MNIPLVLSLQLMDNYVFMIMLIFISFYLMYSFVLGVQSRHLRGTNLKELIYRRDSSDPVGRRASVLLVYQVSDDEVAGMRGGAKIYFARSISSAGVSSYRLNDKDVTFTVYEDMLKNIGVLVKTRNFLVFQGDVESVASKSPADLSKMLEQISESDQVNLLSF